MTFRLEFTDGAARAGTLVTDHGSVTTPFFMPVATRASVRAILHRDVLDAGYEMILANTYHLYLRPGLVQLERMGGLHRFMSWERPVLTDSGGYQVFSLAHLRTVDDDGVTFNSHLDGSLHRFTPESVIEAGRVIGSDILMPLDECPAYPCGRDQAATALERTNRWARRSIEEFGDRRGRYGHSQALFGILQGGTYPDLRAQAASELRTLGFDGYAMGGLAVGEPAETMYRMIDVCTRDMPADRPRYLMGVGTPENLIEAISRGVDMFDCVLPTRNGRNAMFFTRAGSLTITNARHADEDIPVEAGCDCYCCVKFSRSYLRHLFNVKEIAGMTLATIHNLHHYKRLMEEARAAILAGGFQRWSAARLKAMAESENDAPSHEHHNPIHTFDKSDKLDNVDKLERRRD